MCGTNICINGKMVYIGGRLVGLNRLYEVFNELYNSGKRPEDLSGDELLEVFEFYNYVPTGLEEEYKKALLKEFRIYCHEKARKIGKNGGRWQSSLKVNKIQEMRTQWKKKMIKTHYEKASGTETNQCFCGCGCIQLMKEESKDGT